MASLRRKLSLPDPVADTDPAPSPSPAPATPSPFLREQLDALTHAERQAAEAHRQQAIAAEAEHRRATWLNQSRQAQENFGSLGALHKQAIDSGLADTSPDYFRFLDGELDRLQVRQHPTEVVQEMRERVTQDLPQERPQPVPSPNRIVSAPPSRDVPSGYNSPSRIRLSAEQIEVAKRAGISETEYAKQLLKLREMQASGEYSERR
jgi:hypothetical protein